MVGAGPSRRRAQKAGQTQAYRRCRTGTRGLALHRGSATAAAGKAWNAHR